MEPLYILSLIPAIGMYLHARKLYRQTTRRRRIPPSVRARFETHLFGWGIIASLVWFFSVAIITAFFDPEQITLLLLAPAAFAIGEIQGLYAWRSEVSVFIPPRRPEPA